MSIETLKKQLDDVNAAISKVMRGGQMVQTRNGKVQQANLSELRAEKAALEQQLADLRAGYGCDDSFGTPVSYFGRG